MQKEIRKWWELSPMTYDWGKTLRAKIGTREFFTEVDKRFFDAAYFAQQKGEPPFSNLIDYNALKGKQVLEIGCGTGTIAALLAQAGISVTAIDLTFTATKYTRQRFDVYGLKADILQMDAEALGFKDRTFDFVWSWGVIHHSRDTARIISEIYRVLKPGTGTAIMVYNMNSIYFWVYLMLFRGILQAKLLTHSIRGVCNRYSDGLIARYYTARQLIKFFQDSNFTAIKTRIFGQKADVYIISPSIRAWLIRHIPDALTNWLASRLGKFLYITAKKPSTE